MSLRISPCHFCGNQNIEYVKVEPDYEYSFGPGLLPSYYFCCTECGLRGKPVGFGDLPPRKVIRHYNMFTSTGIPCPVADYEPRNDELEIKKLAIQKWEDLKKKKV